ncbi:MAG: hypothetical protein HYX24_02355 [Candidatus Aenigmarchaeota archaeon]|nr:hypothetical protein [Candidatus Aenigmarchaeota archaeon]
MIDYESLKKAVEEFGEVMVRTAANQVYELHRHNIEFIDRAKTIRIDGGTETHWVNADSIESYWIHRKAKD